MRSEIGAELLATIETALVFVAFSSVSEVFRAVLDMTIRARLPCLFCVRGLRVVELREGNHRTKGKE